MRFTCLLLTLLLLNSRNEISDLGISSASVSTDLATAEIWLALNPLVQWNSFYQ